MRLATVHGWFRPLWLSLTVTLVVALPALAAEFLDVEVEEFIDLSGIEADAAHLSRAYREEPPGTGDGPRNSSTESRSTRDRDRQTLAPASAVTEEAVLSYIRGHLQRELTSRSRPELLATLRRPIIQRVLAVSRQPIDRHAFREYTRAARHVPVSERRLALLTELDLVTGETDRIVRQSQRLESMLGADEPTIALSKQDHDDTPMVLRPFVTQQVLQRNLYRYRTVTDEELQEYVGFLASSLGTWYLQLRHGSLTFAVRMASRRVQEARGTPPSAHPANGRRPLALS